MNGESINTPKPVKCNHVWKKVGNAEEADGSSMLVCEQCGKSIHTKPTVMEKQKDGRPLLME